jgi:hypothetical protein
MNSRELLRGKLAKTDRSRNKYHLNVLCTDETTDRQTEADKSRIWRQKQTGEEPSNYDQIFPLK